MKDTLLHTSQSGERSFVIVFDPGDEVVSGLEAFARKEEVFAASLTALGALSSATLGYSTWRPRPTCPSRCRTSPRCFP